MSSSGAIIDDFLEVVESLPLEVRAAFYTMRECDHNVETLHKSITKHKQKILHAIKDPGFDVGGFVSGQSGPAAQSVGNSLLKKMIEKLDKDRKRAGLLMGKKIETCQSLLSALETYLPVLSQEIQRSTSTNIACPQPRHTPFSGHESLSPSPFRSQRRATPENSRASPILTKTPNKRQL